jgi:hypothetical protein
LISFFKRNSFYFCFFHSAIRALLRRRSQVETKYIKHDIIRDYTKYESEAYGPFTRNGYFPDKLTDKYLVKSRFLDTYTGLLELESTLPSNALKIRLPAPKRISTTKDGHVKRQFRRERDLNNIFKVRFFSLPDLSVCVTRLITFVLDKFKDFHPSLILDRGRFGSPSSEMKSLLSCYSTWDN